MTRPAWEGSNYDDYLYTGPQGSVMAYLHRKMEAPFGSQDFFPQTVEVGAGEGQHLPYIRHRYNKYVMTDIRDRPDLEAAPANVIFERADAEELPFGSNSVDRIVSTCVLHHLMDPEKALQNWRTVLRSGGCLTLLLATDPGVAHRVGRHLTTRPAARKLGIDFDLEMAREHRNHALSLMRMIDHTYRSDHTRYVGLPFPWRTWNFNFSSIYQIRIR